MVVTANVNDSCNATGSFFDTCPTICGIVLVFCKELTPACQLSHNGIFVACPAPSSLGPPVDFFHLLAHPAPVVASSSSRPLRSPASCGCPVSVSAIMSSSVPAGDGCWKRPRPGPRADPGDHDPSASDGDDSRHRRRLRLSVPSELPPTHPPPENTRSTAAWRAAMTKWCPPVPPLQLDRLAFLLSECPDLDIDLFSFPACPLFTSRKGIDPLFLDDLVQANSGKPVSGSVLLSLRAVFDAAVKASAAPVPSPASAAGHAPAAPATDAAAAKTSTVPLPSPASAASHAPVAPATAAAAGGLDADPQLHDNNQEHDHALHDDAAPPSCGAATPSTVSAPADGRPTAGAAAQPASGDAFGCGDSATNSSSSSDGEDEESTVDENGSPVVRVTCKTWERPCVVALVLTEGHNPNNNKCAQAVDDAVRLCNLHLAPRYAAFGTRTWAKLIDLWRKNYKTPGKIARGRCKHKSSKKRNDNQTPVEVAECTYDLLIAAAPEAARSTSTGPHEWLQDIVRRMAAD